MAVLEALALSQALVALVVMAVTVAVAVVVVVEVMEELVASGGRGVEALGRSERAVVEVALAAEG